MWLLGGDVPSIVEAEGPATLLVPAESVRLMAVDLPLSSRTKRLEALPFAVEDQIAESIDQVHLALGESLGDKRYLVGVVRRETMERWLATASEYGLGGAAMVPDALALPGVDAGRWWIDCDAGRAMVRTGEGGFACRVSLLRSAWEAAGRPDFSWSGDAPPEEMAGHGSQAAIDRDGLLARLAKPALDLRQGEYARGGAGGPLWRRAAWIVGIGVAAHAAIALADTAMLHVIADRREAETRALVAQMAPQVTLGEDPVDAVTELLPVGGGGAVPQLFLPTLSRISGALAPIGGGLRMQAMAFQADTLTLDFAADDTGLAARIETALRSAGVAASVAESPDGTIRVTASAA
ncbi:general secretion pathway protein GspL [Sphingosinithalassobacter tenebrarum]|uniref:General secretion pathway protein GspL n=1 Tax=Stakelama tenebrarum TaxID=2711215 RepID=A0A6G6YB76_9SPHN|nr:general secretion pathway protein GspL [Sphingosinithalassobacter tenebrarum]